MADTLKQNRDSDDRSGQSSVQKESGVQKESSSTDTGNQDLVADKTGQLRQRVASIPHIDQECTLQKLNDTIEFSRKYHEGQKRALGEPYLTHPLEVATIIAEMDLDCVSLQAALLHDILEDTDIDYDELAETFGEEVAHIVDGVTKITRIKKFPTTAHYSADNIRKMLFAMTRDIRVIFIKLADRLHNMRTLGPLPPDKQKRIGEETLNIYAPLANRLGIGWIKNELEDLSLKYLDSEAYYTLKEQIESTRQERQKYVDDLKQLLSEELNKRGLDFSIRGRAKHFYSIYKKMHNKGHSFQDIMDLTALRLITNSVPECYQVLGIVHSLFRPLYHRFKDYIALPKSNMYASLHTTVIGQNGKLLEIQIRTREMDIIAEEGAASHLIYKAHYEKDHQAPAEVDWLKKLKGWKQSLNDPQGFMQEIREDLLQDEIYVFTPKGDVKRLASGATAVDFAYHIHTEVGHHCFGAKVNGKMVPLKTVLNNCDIVEILTSRAAKPSLSWLKFVKSSHAKSKIRNYLKKYLDSEKLQTQIKPDRDEGEIHKLKSGSSPQKGQRSTAKSQKSDKKEVTLDGDSNLLFDFAQCCNPLPGNAIIGYVSRGRGIIIHRRNCPNLAHLSQDSDRIVYPAWKGKEPRLRGELSLLVSNSQDILAEIVVLTSASNVGISSVRKLETDNERTELRLEVECTNLEEWELLLQTLKKSPLVQNLQSAHIV